MDLIHINTQHAETGFKEHTRVSRVTSPWTSLAYNERDGWVSPDLLK